MTLKDLAKLALEKNRIKYPSMPEYARYIKPYKDKTANELTRTIIDFINMTGGQAERISVTGRYIDNSKIVTDVLGRQRKIGSGKYIKGSMTCGSADISSTYKGRSIKIEVKIGKDKMSEAQYKYKESIEAAGGIYLVAQTWEQFYNDFTNLNL